jgi:3-isopropylmalate/(R)-2-methylmalate dehydratase small subunit
LTTRPKLDRIESETLVLAIDNIDTDQIYPGRFLTVTTREGLGEKLFADWRLDREGRPRPDFPLNRPEARTAQVLVGGRNFGCGSSREHAPWALLDWGFRAVVAASFADIFRANALKNGLVPVEVLPDAHAFLLANPGVRVAVDLVTRALELPGGRRVHFPLDPFARHCLLEGLDELGFLLSQDEAITAFERARTLEVT